MSDAGTRLNLLLAIVGFVLFLAPAAAAKTIDVRPQGPAVNVIQRAINKASPGDRIRVHEGRYRGEIRVTKKLSIFGARNEKRPTIDARCDSSMAVDVLASGVSLQGLKVVGAIDTFAINFNNIKRGVVDDVRMDNTCGGALYGVNVFGQGAIKITDSNATGFTDAGYYVGSINTTSGGKLLIRRNEASGNNRGAIVEDSFDDDVDIRVLENDFHDNTIPGEGIPSGIFVHNSDRTLIERNETNDNGVYGIHVDSESDDNIFNDNESTGNGTANYFNEGTGNCGSGNSFPIPAC